MAGALVVTAPGKVMLAGEYAVLDGGRALVAAVDRRAQATLDQPATAAPSEFLQAARVVVARELGGEIAAAFERLVVDTDALRDGAHKLGLGSSAAATVAAIGAAIAAPLPAGSDLGPWRATIARLSAIAHAEAQGPRGARGSGADIAASTWGGVIDVRRGAPATALTLPADLQLGFAWTGQPADTATLVAAVRAGRARTPIDTDRALAAIADAADALAGATTASQAIAAIAAGGRAMTALAAATGVDLVPASVTALAATLAPLGATAKTTGAGGGDVVLIAASATIDHHQLDAAVVAAGLSPLRLSVDPTGVAVRRPRSAAVS